MSHTSTIQILKLETKQSKKLNPETGKPFESLEARVALLDDDGVLETVGRLRVPRALADSVKLGTFRASFALTVPDYGENKGDVVSVLTGLMPMVPARASAPAAASAAKA